MKTILLASALLAAAALPSFAQGLVTDGAKVEAGTYTIEPEHTRVRFDVSHFGFTKYDGEFRKVSGTMTLDPAKPDASKVDITIATNSVMVPNAKLKEELDGAQWLDAAKFPEITFKSTKVVATGADTADVTGDFTLHGVTKPLTLKVKLNGAGVNMVNKHYTSGFEAKGTIKRADFGVKTYVPMVSDAVDLDIDAAFEKTK
ncbi:YceI family protein [Lichenibacterium ramalinae]|uniref:Polyisoprenoid-binding protein n=1 Tax=Lichenibacterium ramalinae TaxID=2316527 RepID=A0A4Q2R9Q7_9HYPH|nr:YceI family protein [Lichenibacterium ramalinae]RYB03634.1 polyisoprenoid-binding protein [Lichenibacterium ramalinae]